MDIFIILEMILFAADFWICFVFLTCFIVKKNEVITKPAIAKNDLILFGLLNLLVIFIMFLLDTLNEFFIYDYPMFIVQILFLVPFYILILNTFKVWKTNK